MITGALLALGNAQSFSNPRPAVQTLVAARELALSAGDRWSTAASEVMIGISAALCQDAELHGQYTDGLAARLDQLGDPAILAAHWTFVSYLAYPRGEFARVRIASQLGLAAAREINDPTLEWAAFATGALADIATGRVEPAMAGLRAAEASTLDPGNALALLAIARAMSDAACGDLLAAAHRLDVVLANEGGGVFDAVIWATTTLAEVLRLQGHERARAAAAHGLELAESVDNRWHAARNKLVQGRLASARRDWSDAALLNGSAFEVIVQHGYRLEQPAALEALAEVVAGLDRPTEAAKLLGGAARVREELGLVAWPAQEREVDAVTTQVRTALGATLFERARSEGAELDEDAIALLAPPRRRLSR